MSPTEIEAIAQRAAERAVEEALKRLPTQLGFDPGDPAQLAHHYRRQAYLDRLMEGDIELRKIIKRSALGVIVSALVVAGWQAVQLWAQGKIGG